MKKHILTLSFLMMGLSIYAAGIAVPSNEVEKALTEIVKQNDTLHENETTTVDPNDEALRCKVELSNGRNTVTMSCWFCDCDKLTETAMESLYELQTL